MLRREQTNRDRDSLHLTTHRVFCKWTRLQPYRMTSQNHFDSTSMCITGNTYACDGSKGAPNVSHWYSDLGIPTLSHPAFHLSAWCVKKNVSTLSLSLRAGTDLLILSPFLQPYLLFRFCLKGLCFHKAVANTYRTFLHSFYKLLLLLEGLLEGTFFFFLDSPILPTYYSLSPLHPPITSSFISSSRSFTL